jgi:hypothetical protein
MIVKTVYANRIEHADKCATIIKAYGHVAIASPQPTAAAPARHQWRLRDT